MHPGLMIALQVTSLTPVRPDFAPPAPRIDTRSPMEKSRDACASQGAGDAIIVCARRDADRYRASAPPPGHEEGALRAETSLGGKVKGSIDVEQIDIGGAPSNRVKVTIKVPF